MEARMKSCMLILLVVMSLSVSACGGGGTTGTTPPPPSSTYTIGGTVSGLSGSGLVLQNNDGNNLSVSANGSFMFTGVITSGGTYNVTVFSQPSSPAQNCAVTNGSGTANANVSSVQVSCSTVTYTIGGTVSGLSGTGQLALTLVWQTQPSPQSEEILGVEANGSFTFPGAFASGTTYSVTVDTQPSNPVQTCVLTNGAAGTVTADVTNVTVDCGATTGPNEWAWVNGANYINQGGAYGTQDTAAAGNIPGARDGSISWTDKAGNFWLFGGSGWSCCYPGETENGELNDLWKYSAGEWTWMGGSNAVNQYGTYGTQGTAAADNIPGARANSISWTDAAGNLWLFGGLGLDSAGTDGELNDLWKYSAGQWTWMGGSNAVNQYGTYGTQGTAAAGNIPGARDSSISWTDAAGNLWLFGGEGYDSAGKLGFLNDLWKYSAGEWTWMGGSNVVNQSGTYGTQGTAAAGNIPGARRGSISWTDAAGNLWLFGGEGGDSTGTQGYLNDLWKYSAGQWMWVSGSNVVNQGGTYGTQGTSAASNIPGARLFSISWIDTAGNFWLFGGTGYYTNDVGPGLLNDLWKYSAGQWTWMGGSLNQNGIYGTMGTAAGFNIPGSRAFSVSWTDAAGSLWLFGGHGLDSAGTDGDLNDLWKYQP